MMLHPDLYFVRCLHAIGVSPFRGFIRPTLRVTRIHARNDIETDFPLRTHAAKPEAVGPMKPLQGSTLIASKNGPHS